MSRSLPSRRSLSQFEAEARNLLHDLKRSDATALRRYSAFDPLAGHFQPRLADAQYVVARRYGFKSWQELKQRILSADERHLRRVQRIFPT